MADSSVAITAGSGTTIDTRTEGTNSHHRQVIVIGDPATNAGVAPVDATNGLTVALSPTDNAVLDNIEMAVRGPSAPSAWDSYSSAVVDLAAATANQVLVAAPGANKQIWVYGLFIKADTGAGTITLQDEDDTALSGAMALADEGHISIQPSGNFAMPWVKCATNKALEADTGGTATLDGVLTYAVVDVT